MTETMEKLMRNSHAVKIAGLVITLLAFAGGTIAGTLKVAGAMEEANRGQMRMNHSIEMLRVEMRGIKQSLDDIRRREELNTEFRLRSEGR